jgi:hypothetical protein
MLQHAASANAQRAGKVVTIRRVLLAATRVIRTVLCTCVVYERSHLCVAGCTTPLSWGAPVSGATIPKCPARPSNAAPMARPGSPIAAGDNQGVHTTSNGE